MVDPTHPRISIVWQCRLVSIARSSFSDAGTGESPLTLRLMRLIDEQFLETPFYGSRQMTRWLRRQGDMVSRKRVRRLMRLLGVHALYQRPRTSQPHPAHRIYPYLLRDLPVTRPNHVWCTDVTDIPLRRGFLYLVAVMDWASRTGLSWRLSNTLDASFCLEALHEARSRSRNSSGPLRGENGASRRTAENGGSRPEKCRLDCRWRTGRDEVTQVYVEQWWRAPPPSAKNSPESLRGPGVRPQDRTQPAARDRAGCRTPVNHTECAHRRRVRSASSAPWRHTEACLPAWVASASHASAASRLAVAASLTCRY